jgi:hypothetical protein
MAQQASSQNAIGRSEGTVRGRTEERASDKRTCGFSGQTMP